MIVDIEEQYYDYISEAWRKFSDVTSDILRPDLDLQHAYDVISLCSNEFLQDKLKSLETQQT